MAARHVPRPCTLLFAPLLLFWDPAPKHFDGSVYAAKSLAPFATTYLNYDPNSRTTSTSVQCNWDQSSSAWDNINPRGGAVSYTVNDQCTLLGVKLDGPGHDPSVQVTATYPNSVINLGTYVGWNSGTNHGGTTLSTNLIYSGEQDDPTYSGAWSLPGLSSYLTIEGIDNVNECYYDLQSGVNSLTGAKALTLTGSALPYTLSTTSPATDSSPTSPPPAPVPQPTTPIPQSTTTKDFPESKSSTSTKARQQPPASTALADTPATSSDAESDISLPVPVSSTPISIDSSQDTENLAGEVQLATLLSSSIDSTTTTHVEQTEANYSTSLPWSTGISVQSDPKTYAAAADSTATTHKEQTEAGQSPSLPSVTDSAMSSELVDISSSATGPTSEVVAVSSMTYISTQEHSSTSAVSDVAPYICSAIGGCKSPDTSTMTTTGTEASLSGYTGPAYTGDAYASRNLRGLDLVCFSISMGICLVAIL